MAIAKGIEVLAEGDTVEDAVKDAVEEASKTVKNIKHVYVQEIQAHVEDNVVTKFRVNAKVTFVVGGA
jgi:flavin-binding protein dodecin